MVPFTLHHLCHHQVIWHMCMHPGDLQFFWGDLMRGPTLVQSNAWVNMESEEFLGRKKNSALHAMDLEALLPSLISASLHVFIRPYVISSLKQHQWMGLGDGSVVKVLDVPTQGTEHRAPEPVWLSCGFDSPPIILVLRRLNKLARYTSFIYEAQ